MKIKSISSSKNLYLLVSKTLVILSISFLVTNVNGVTVNPLPKPQVITWGEKGPISFPEEPIVSKPENDILDFAWQRAIDRIIEERWEPQTIEAEPSPYPPFPPKIGPSPNPTKKKCDFFDRRSDFKNVQPIPKSTPNIHLSNVEITIQDLNAELQHGVDESYELNLNEDGKLTIIAPTVWGALHAFETLTQLVISDGKDGLLIERTVKIKDSPLYPHRGVLLDTGRNFYPVKDILRTIEALGWSKLNVLHWHIVDSASWPLQLKSYKEMTKDAYSQREIYRPKDVQTIIRFARERGVRVIPELDMPGHSRAGYQQIDLNLVACGNSWWSNDNWDYFSALDPPPGQLDIINPKTYKVIKNIFKEVAAAFPDKLYHAGFDELQQYCYAYSQYVSNWFSQNSNVTYQDLVQYFFDKVYPIFTAKENGGKRIIMWEDIFLSKNSSAKHVPKEVILQTWNEGINNTKKLVKNGYDVIVSSADWFYLDCGFGGWNGNDPNYDQDINDESSNINFGGNGGSWCNSYKTWQRIYSYDFTFNLTIEEKKHVLGAELALWSEQSDGIVIDSKLWPRAAAFGELLWSGNKDEKGRKRYREMQQRINEFRERLVIRGVGALPLQPKWCYKHPHECDFSLKKFIKD
ncbi:hypothetical protein G9A89_023791 [Geosiphon pyriformis]|nr:hypothetical protein G9A89_023791 [Geosiphon pyriformis]